MRSCLTSPTPRTIKRFRNSLRYFAAMLRAEHGAEMDWRREANLVALAAMHHLGVDVPEPATPEQAARVVSKTGAMRL